MEIGWNVCWDFQHQRFAAPTPAGGWKQKSTSSYSKPAGGWQGAQQAGDWGVAQVGDQWPGAWAPGALPVDQQLPWPVAPSPFGGDGPFSGDAASDGGSGGPKGRGRGRAGKGKGAEWWKESGDSQWGGGSPNSWAPWTAGGKGKGGGWADSADQWGGKNSIKAGGKPGSQQGKGKGGSKGGGKSSDGTPEWWPDEPWNAGTKGGMSGKSTGKVATPPPSPAVQPEKSKEKKDDVNSEIDALLAVEGVGLQRADFDFRVRRFLQELHKGGGRVKVRDALAMVQEYTQHKSREAVKNWPAYLLTLLKKFEPELAAEGGRFEKGRGKGDKKSAAAKEARPLERTQAPSSATAAKPAKKPSASEKPEVAETPKEEEPYASDDETSRDELIGEIRGYLTVNSGIVVCPWTEQQLASDASLAAHYASCLGACTSGDAHSVVAQHLEGLARDQHLARYPQAASSIRAAGGMSFLTSSSSLLDVATAARQHPGKVPSTALEDLALALTSEVLRNWELCPSEKAVKLGELLEVN